MNNVNWGKIGLFLGGMLLTAASTFVNGKIQDDKTREMIAKEVEKQLAAK